MPSTHASVEDELDRHRRRIFCGKIQQSQRRHLQRRCRDCRDLSQQRLYDRLLTIWPSARWALQKTSAAEVLTPDDDEHLHRRRCRPRPAPVTVGLPRCDGPGLPPAPPRGDGCHRHVLHFTSTPLAADLHRHGVLWCARRRPARGKATVRGRSAGRCPPRRASSPPVTLGGTGTGGGLRRVPAGPRSWTAGAAGALPGSHELGCPTVISPRPSAQGIPLRPPVQRVTCGSAARFGVSRNGEPAPGRTSSNVRR